MLIIKNRRYPLTQEAIGTNQVVCDADSQGLKIAPLLHRSSINEDRGVCSWGCSVRVEDMWLPIRAAWGLFVRKSKREVLKPNVSPISLIVSNAEYSGLTVDGLWSVDRQTASQRKMFFFLLHSTFSEQCYLPDYNSWYRSCRELIILNVNVHDELNENYILFYYLFYFPGHFNLLEIH